MGQADRLCLFSPPHWPGRKGSGGPRRRLFGFNLSKDSELGSGLSKVCGILKFRLELFSDHRWPEVDVKVGPLDGGS